MPPDESPRNSSSDEVGRFLGRPEIFLYFACLIVLLSVPCVFFWSIWFWVVWGLALVALPFVNKLSVRLQSIGGEGGFSNWYRLSRDLGLERRDNYPSTPLHATGFRKGRIVEVFERDMGHWGRETVVLIECNDIVPEKLVFQPRIRPAEFERHEFPDLERTIALPPHDNYEFEAGGDVEIERWKRSKGWVDKLVEICRIPRDCGEGTSYRGGFVDAEFRFKLNVPLERLDENEMDEFVSTIETLVERLSEVVAPRRATSCERR